MGKKDGFTKNGISFAEECGLQKNWCLLAKEYGGDPIAFWEFYGTL